MRLRGGLSTLASLALCGVLAGCAGTPTRLASATADAAAVRTVAPERAAAAQGPEAAVDAALTGLDRRARVAQLFVAGVPLDELGAADDLVQQGAGGVFLAGRSTTAAAELAATATDWQEKAPGPRLWLAADQEGGKVQTLRGRGFDALPTAVEQGALPAEQLAALGDGLGASMASAGLNLNLAPVADVVPAGTEAGNEPIGYFERQYGNTGPEVAVDAAAIADGLAAHGVVPTLKHFPGLGRVAANTDTSAGVVDTVTTAGDEQVTAFADALARTAADPFVMVSSAIYTRLDPANQAAFSRTVVTDLLRDRLGFDGVIVSDDLANAAAVRDVPPGERAVRFLAAGGTLVLSVDAGLIPGMIDAVLARSAVDPAFADTVDEAVRTALTAKAEAGLLD
ncbi:glycoside hydrolase family 3 N-terminal domain-containing protein [Blastococcus capsensis]|uniref:glycoside hydrolase family 3 N-terminal domain-containing protein n=1 Tax=Blastococcus capsensis TaxID=1564163 RepID=UPI0025421B9B|nr:glycoside hydrolase family 3 N-terminal domain-containing protein [Blastococcus capsensis]MDK3257616.1 glycoside hydrolase family 3 N-terminal domain-containing protein [Blastococcus capsensis]